MRFCIDRSDISGLSRINDDGPLSLRGFSLCLNLEAAPRLGPQVAAGYDRRADIFSNQTFDNTAGSTVFRGQRGQWASGNYAITGERPWSFNRRNDNNPYEAEHVELFRSIRGARTRINDLQRVANSTLTAIMGRLSAYSGQECTWEQALNSQQNLMPLIVAGLVLVGGFFVAQKQVSRSASGEEAVVRSLLDLANGRRS